MSTSGSTTQPCSIRSAAAHFGISTSTMRRLVASGAISHLRVGKVIRFLPEHITAYERKITVPAASASTYEETPAS